MKNRSHALRVWLTQHDMTVREFASGIGVDGSYLGFAINGDRAISPAFAEKIRLATSGKVGPGHFRISDGTRTRQRKKPLSPAEIRAIREARAQRVSLEILAARHRVSISLISKIAKGTRHA